MLLALASFIFIHETKKLPIQNLILTYAELTPEKDSLTKHFLLKVTDQRFLKSYLKVLNISALKLFKKKKFVKNFFVHQLKIAKENFENTSDKTLPIPHISSIIYQTSFTNL